jgi:hypothetical protein
VIKIKSLTTDEIKLNDALADAGIAAVETDLAELIILLAHEHSSHIVVPAIHKNRAELRELFMRNLGATNLADDPKDLVAVARAHLRAKFLSTPIAVSGANFAVAETGTICIVKSEGNGRMCLTLPEVLISVMGIEKVIPTFQDLEVFLQLLPRSSTGDKTAIEDAIVGLYPHATFNLNPRPSSIDTPLHGFVPYRHVDHMQPNAVIAIAAAKNSERLTREIYGDVVIWTPWQRPGFDLGLILERICQEHPQAKGVILGGHGLIDWADNDKACYELTLDLIERSGGFIAERDKGEQTFGGHRYESLDQERRHPSLPRSCPGCWRRPS